MTIFEIDKGKAKRVRLSDLNLKKTFKDLLKRMLKQFLIAVLLQQNFLQEIFILDELTL